VGAFAEERVAQVGAEKSGSSGYDDKLALPILHEICPYRGKDAKLQTLCS
jgi:hypothetical protein